MHKDWKRLKDMHTLDMLIKHFTEVWFGNCRLWYGMLINTILADLGDKMTYLFLLSLLRKKDIFQFLLQDAKIKPLKRVKATKKELCGGRWDNILVYV